MCRNLFYTLDSDLMGAWLSGQAQPRRTSRTRRTRTARTLHGVREFTRDGADGGQAWDFLTDLQREDSLRTWASGSVRYPSGYRAHLKCPACQPSAWIPPRHALILHTAVEPEARACLLNRGRTIARGSVRSGRSSRPRPIQAAERLFMDSLKPLLGVWYGRLLLLRALRLPWLIAQADPRAWPALSGRGAGCGGILECPSPGSVLWRGGEVVEMFGAWEGDMCCCSLVEDAADPAVQVVESDFLDNLGFVLSGSSQGTVIIDIDADYAEPA